jgi:hypothetical protein
MPKHQHLHCVGAIAPRRQDSQLQHLAQDHVTNRQDHDRQRAAIRRSHSGRKRTSTPRDRVSELHNLDLGTRIGAEASDQIKYLSERIPATFVLAGVDLEGNGLFAGRRGGQIASRYTLIRTTAFPYSTSDERAAWQALVATLENALHLHAHRKGTLLRLSGYLHERTGGMIGSLSHLIREAAIINQTEKINQAGLDVVDLDQTAEQHRTMLKRRRRTTGRGSAA